MVVRRPIIPFVAMILTGCTLATGPQTSAPATGFFGAAGSGPLRIDGSEADGKPSVDGIGAGSFPRSFLIPRTNTSIRFGG